MSDYGLLSRKLALDVKYNSCPEGVMHATVPVFAVGREQLYQMFGLNHRERTRKLNRHIPFYGNPDVGCYALVIGAKRVNDEHEYEYSNTLYFWESFILMDSCVEELKRLLEVESEDYESGRMEIIHIYEVWQICDDYNLYAHWDMSADRCMCETGQNHKFSQAWRLSYEDTADYQSEIEYQKEQRLSPIRHYFMSNDYLSSLKTYNAHHLEALRQLREAGELERKSRMKETCYFCGSFLPGKNYSVHVGDDMKLVCRACFNLFNEHDHDGLRYRTIDTFICDCCGRTMKEKYYVDTSIGVYCSECKAKNPDLGEYFVCDRCGKRLSVEHLSHTVSGVYCKHCKSVLCEGLSSCCGDICDPGTFPDPTCHGCEYSNRWSLYYE